MPDDKEIVDRILHIEEMKEQLQQLAGGQAIIRHTDENLPLDVEEQFLEHVLAFERGEKATHRELLARDGVALPAAEELTDEELARALAEVIRGLAGRRTFLENTDHLSDRELYSHLWEDILDDEVPLLPPDSLTNCHIDILGGCSEEDIDLWLTYYADEDDRARWAQDFPEDEIPPHRDPPYDRDRRLPKPPPPPSRYDDPEVTAAWVAECRARLLQALAADGLSHGPIDEEPNSYAPGFACIWEVPNSDAPGAAGWWAINGDLPTEYLPTTEVPDPRAFLRAVAQHWRAAAETIESGLLPAELAVAAPEGWPCTGPVLRRRAGIVDKWAADDEAWEEE